MKNINSPILQLNNLSIGYKKPLLSAINTHIETGEIVLLIGKNGTGKTTLLKTIFKELPILNGNITISDFTLDKIPFSEIGKLIAVVLAKNTSINPSLKVFDLLSLGRYPYKKWYQPLDKKEVTMVHETLELLEITQYQDYQISELSDGNLQKALIARALVQDCPLLILDEPTSHLDIPNKLEITRILKLLAKEKGKTILFTSHDLHLGLTIADKLWLIKDGQLSTGFTEDLAYQEDLLNYFSNKKLKFDYSTHEYKSLSNGEETNIQVIGNSSSIYWLKKALIKNNYKITEQSTEITIAENNNRFILHYKLATHTFSSIQDIIQFLKS